MKAKIILGLVIFISLALTGGCISSTPTPTATPTLPQAIDTPASNMAAMPIVDASYYDNPVVYAAPNSDHPAAQIAESITAQAVADGLPGVILLVSTPKDGTWVSAKGSIDLKNNIPLKPNSLSRIGSITKMFTAVVIHQLVQEEKLSLDDLASKYLPDEVTRGIANANKATIRQLLGHTSGIPNYTDYFDIPALYSSGTNKDQTSTKALDWVRGVPAYFAPGTDCLYSNTNYILLGLVAEKVTGKTMQDLYEERIFTPLNMKSTYYDPDAPVQRGVARGYIDYPAGNLIDTTDFDQATRTPDGGIVSNVYDMATFLQALIQDKRLLSEAEYAEMTSDFRWDAKVGGLDGLGILKFNMVNGEIAYGYHGGHFAYAAELWYVPARELTIAYLTNGSSWVGAHVKPLKDFQLRVSGLLVNEMDRVLP
jgi:D-alanyl-D-alanine carboxypeptidase